MRLSSVSLDLNNLQKYKAATHNSPLKISNCVARERERERERGLSECYQLCHRQPTEPSELTEDSAGSAATQLAAGSHKRGKPPARPAPPPPRHDPPRSED